MELYGITLDFNDLKSCGIKEDMCLDFDNRSDELSENEKLISYWDNNIKQLLEETDKVVIINDKNKSMVYSNEEEAITLIKKHFKEMEVTKIDYEDLNRCDFCVQHDYLEKIKLP